MASETRIAAALVAGIAGILVNQPPPAEAGVKTSTAVRYYTVSGSSRESLARTVGGNPLHSSAGASIASIDANFDLSLAVENRGRQCVARDAIVSAKFVITLPQASETDMSPVTRKQWRGLVSFARRHEERHREIYVQCFHEFLGKTKALQSRASCGALKTDAQRLFNATMNMCKRRQEAFDRSESARLESLPIFRTR
jgi:predicted secreted Zn-dependent protease